MKFLKTSGNRKFIIGVVVGALLASGTAVGANLFNTPESGYLLCVNKTSKAVTYPSAQKCPTGFTQLVLGARGLTGETGAKGDTGAPGPPGRLGRKVLPVQKVSQDQPEKMALRECQVALVHRDLLVRKEQQVSLRFMIKIMI